MNIVVDSDSFAMVLDGSKTHEICIFTGDYRYLKDNDIVVIQDDARWFTAILTRVAYHRSLETVFEETNYKHFSPDAFSVNHAIMLYEERRNFRHEELSGLVAFRIKRISEPTLNFKNIK